MSRRLTLLRHAKSSWEHPGLDDFDRPLNNRGQLAARTMGERMNDRGHRPSLILSSAAVRAMETANLLADTINYPREFIHRDRRLYLASPDEMLAVLAEEEDTFADVVLIGHNPGISHLAHRLTGAGPMDMPTAAMTVISFAVSNWKDVDGARGELTLYDYPKNPNPPSA